MNKRDYSLIPAAVSYELSSKHLKSDRRWQGIPGIEVTERGTIYGVFYSGGVTECGDNFVGIFRSRDGGATFGDVFAVIDPPYENVRAYDSTPWLDPSGRLWIFWNQSYDWFDGRAGVFATFTRNPDDDRPIWSAPRRIANGVMMNKPTVLSDGRWLLPCAVWPKWDFVKTAHTTVPDEISSNVYVSDNSGVSFRLLGRSKVTDNSFNEHMVVEKHDGSLWMLTRTKLTSKMTGIEESFSSDGGSTWTDGVNSPLLGVDSRFFIRRLASGRLIFVNNDPGKARGRVKMSAWLSDDDGVTWPHKLELDDRANVSYPDGTERNGYIWLTYDRGRNEVGSRESLMAKLTERDIIAGKLVDPQSRLKIRISSAEGLDPNV